MKILIYFSTLLTLAMITSCNGISPFSKPLAPESIVGFKMDASGLEGSYHYEFLEDETYRRIKIFPSGKKSPVEKGNWKWERTSQDFAILTFDRDLEVKLQFTTQDHANATIPTSDRLFPVEFREPVSP